MKTRLKAKQEYSAIDVCILKQELDTSDTTAHLKQEPHFRNHAVAIDTPKQEFQQPDMIRVKTELSYEDVKMADDSDSGMSNSTTSDIVKQEAMRMSPSLELDTKSHQAEIRSASLRIEAKQKESDSQIERAIVLERPTASSTNDLAKAFEKSGRDYFYQCHLCTELKTTLLDLLDHHSKIHRFTYRSRTYKHLELEPNPQDPNFYCRVCETTYPSINMFKKHFRLVHYMITKTTRSPPTITPLQAIKIEKEIVVPDRDDPSNYCRACKKFYVNQHRYRSHLAKFHDMPKFGKKQGVLPDIFDPNFYCRSCERGLSTKARFKKHCLRWHNVVVPDEKDLPNVHDPTFHCKPCDKTFGDKDTFWQHCRETHLITNFKEKGLKPFCNNCNRSYASEFRYKRHRRLVHGETFPFITTRTPKLVSDLPPDINDPNHYCRACDKKLACRAGFRTHLAVFHDIFLPVKKFKHPSARPKKKPFQKNDRKYHCLICDNAYPTTIKYREHLELIHHVQGAASEIRAHVPSYLPDPDDPNLHCRTCGKTKSTLERYRKHLKNIHHMILPKLQRNKTLHHAHSSDEGSAATPPSPRKSFTVHKCPVCSKRVKSERRFAYHLKSAHKELIDTQDVAIPDAPQVDAGSSNCSACGANFENATTLEHHVQEVHKNTEEDQAVDQDIDMTDCQSEGTSSSDSMHSDDTLGTAAADEKDDQSEETNDDLSKILNVIDQAIVTFEEL
ncbi:uncharacterized protein ATC70_001899 [Mucor velutinosus]|uniref:C2H2-type domain-containing protein n=1 Tax=Mucor velutinosus TaxID=708070 RepID=A0AAN7DBC1_9FUNG|nr:hypothetical protein ATC70_001899 [Mucor velutinosus]